jgi:hypothetical protein
MAMLMPPSQYDHPPQVSIIEKVVPWNELQRFCRGIVERDKIRTATGAGVWGCAGVVKGKCYVFRIDNLDVRRHELAHCSGWPHDHPGGWYDAPLHER